MKNISVIILLLLIISCNSKSKLSAGLDYRIVKIDSIENVYLLYAERTDVSIPNTKIIKIASTKTGYGCKKNRSIIVEHNYKLNLKSLYPENFVSHHYLGGITFNGVYIPFEKDYNIKKNLFSTEDIKGLCYNIK